MKKFEEKLEQLKNNSHTNFYGYMGIRLLTEPEIIETFKDWVSPEDHQNTVASNKAYEKSNRTLSEENAKFVVENIELQKQIAELKSQLEKQQPEIPEFVAEVFEDNAVFLTAEKMDIISWFNDRSSDREWDKVTLWARENQDKFIQYVMNRKPVEKQFYLKHIDFCKRDKDYDWYMIKHSDGPLNHLRVEKETLPPTVDTYFTQQEIDSMETGSYEQIEVEE